MRAGAAGAPDGCCAAGSEPPPDPTEPSLCWGGPGGAAGSGGRADRPPSAGVPPQTGGGEELLQCPRGRSHVGGAGGEGRGGASCPPLVSPGTPRHRSRAGAAGRGAPAAGGEVASSPAPGRTGGGSAVQTLSREARALRFKGRLRGELLENKMRAKKQKPLCVCLGTTARPQASAAWRECSTAGGHREEEDFTHFFPENWTSTTVLVPGHLDPAPGGAEDAAAVPPPRAPTQHSRT